jgi:hypothetical protein
VATLTQVRETTRFLEAGSRSARLAVNRDTAYPPRCYAFTRHQRLTTLAASAGCWHARPLGVFLRTDVGAEILAMAAHGYPGSRHER